MSEAEKKIKKFVWSLSAGRFQPFVLVKGYEPILKREGEWRSHWGSLEVEGILATETPERRKELESKWASFSNIVERGSYDLMQRSLEGEVITPYSVLLADTSNAIKESLIKRFGDDPDIEVSEYGLEKTESESLGSKKWRLRVKAEELLREIREEKAKHG